MKIDEMDEKTRKIELWKMGIITKNTTKTHFVIQIPRLFEEDSHITFILDAAGTALSYTDTEGLDVLYEKLYTK